MAEAEHSIQVLSFLRERDGRCGKCTYHVMRDSGWLVERRRRFRAKGFRFRALRRGFRALLQDFKLSVCASQSWQEVKGNSDLIPRPRN